MSDDLIKRAREAAEPWDYGEPDTLITELADRIEAQAAEIERLREALAAAYIELSGKDEHASDCATSNAPAMTPGRCNCE